MRMPDRQKQRWSLKFQWQMGRLPTSRMASPAPKAAPWVTPRKPGSTSGFRNSICMTAPAAARLMPSVKAEINLGRRRFSTRLRARASLDSNSGGIQKGFGYLPMKRDTSRMTSGTAMSNATRQNVSFFKSGHRVCVILFINVAFDDQCALEKRQDCRCDHSFIHAIECLIKTGDFSIQVENRE